MNVLQFKNETIEAHWHQKHEPRALWGDRERQVCCWGVCQQWLSCRAGKWQSSCLTLRVTWADHETCSLVTWQSPSCLSTWLQNSPSSLAVGVSICPPVPVSHLCLLAVCLPTSVSGPRLPACLLSHVYLFSWAYVHESGCLSFFLLPVNHFILNIIFTHVMFRRDLGFAVAVWKLNLGYLHSCTCFPSRVSLHLALFMCPSAVDDLKHDAAVLRCMDYSSQGQGKVLRSASGFCCCWWGCTLFISLTVQKSDISVWQIMPICYEHEF